MSNGVAAGRTETSCSGFHSGAAEKTAGWVRFVVEHYQHGLLRLPEATRPVVSKTRIYALLTLGGGVDGVESLRGTVLRS